VAASLTKDSYDGMRVIQGFPLTIIFAVLGIAIIGDMLKTGIKKLPGLTVAFYSIILTLSACFLFLFYSAFFTQYRESSKLDFQYGIAQFSEFLIQHNSDFDSVTVDSHINQPYIYYLFFSKEDPHRYNYAEITYPKNSQPGIMGIPKLDNYIYARVSPETVAGATELLSVTDENGKIWYKVFAKNRKWYVQMQYDNFYDPLT
jgi:hypothetical protein